MTLLLNGERPKDYYFDYTELGLSDLKQRKPCAAFERGTYRKHRFTLIF